MTSLNPCVYNEPEVSMANNTISRPLRRVKPHVTGEVQCVDCGHRWDVKRGGLDIRAAEKAALAEECPGPNHPPGPASVVMTAGIKRTIRRLLEGEYQNLRRTTAERLAGLGLAVQRARPMHKTSMCYPLHPERFAERCEELGILRPELGTVRDRRCADCGQHQRCEWDICPYEAGVGGVTDPARAMWLCEQCQSERAASI